MKCVFNLIQSILIFSVIGLSSLAQATECSKDVWSSAILDAYKASAKQVIDRSDTAYSYGVNVLQLQETPKFCQSAVEGSDLLVSIKFEVYAGVWSEDGDEGERWSDCYMDLKRPLKNSGDDYEPYFITCEDLMIEEDID